MRISQRMQAKQSQKLHMSPQLQQSILVLQMNNLVGRITAGRGREKSVS